MLTKSLFNSASKPKFDITARLNSAEAKEVFRRHHITATGIEGLRQGHAKKGDMFMFDLIKSLSPKSSVLRGNFGDSPDDIGPVLPADWTAPTDDTKQGLTFEDWMKKMDLLGFTIAGLKSNILGSVKNTAADDMAPVGAKKSNTLVYVVAGVVILAIAFLIFKQSK